MLAICIVVFVVLPLIGLVFCMWRMQMAMCHPDDFERFRQWEAEKKARLKERQIVAEGVVIAEGLQQSRAVPAAAEANSVAALVGGHGQRVPGLSATGIEGRVHIDEVEGGWEQSRQHTRVLGADDEVAIEGGDRADHPESHRIVDPG